MSYAALMTFYELKLVWSGQKSKIVLAAIVVAWAAAAAADNEPCLLKFLLLAI